MSGIVFQVETSRILPLLTREIYDSPLALLRENVQNAYDAIRMRFAPAGTLTPGGRIDVNLDGNRLTVSDNGIGMAENVLRNNFWKAGSSGKHSDSARRSGVVGTFGIGALANFGVSESLTVETRPEGSASTLRSSAELASLEVGKDCISFEEISPATRDVGTTVSVVLDAQHLISVESARAYLEPYVSLLDVPVYLNGTLISQATPRSRLSIATRSFTPLAARSHKNNACGAQFAVEADANGQVLVEVTSIELGGVAVAGSMLLLQSGGPLMALRSRFGLAPVPASGFFQFGGFVDLSVLQPTAGREALSRDSIDRIARLLQLAEHAAAEVLAATPAADKNNSFLQWLLSNNRLDLADRVTVRCLPDERDVALGDVKAATSSRTVHYFTGTEPDIIKVFAGDQAALLLISQSSPRRKVQLQYVSQRLQIPEVPDRAHVGKVYKGSELSAAEASVLLRTAGVLRDDYLIPEVDVVFADISHGVTVLASERNGALGTLHIARSSKLLEPLVQCYQQAYGIFGEFIKDFVRVTIYPRIQQFVPSSTRGGVDALRKQLERNRELYRYEEAELGDVEGLLGEYLRDAADLKQVIQAARSAARVQTQRVSREQVGTIETELKDVVGSPVVAAEAGAEFEARPPISRESLVTNMKILTTSERHPQLNNFTMLLGLSDRLMQREAPFFRTPHTTRILWGGHRVIYIFTEATGGLSLYYDIELHEPLERTMTGGGLFPTTTLITKNRIFVPIPDALAPEFRIGAGQPKEFYVRFDVLSVGSS